MGAIWDGEKRDNCKRQSAQFIAALMCAISSDARIISLEDINKLHEEWSYTDLSKFFAWCFRHTDYLRSDGLLFGARAF